MNVKVHIERLVLEGLPVGPQDGARVRAAVTAELEHLIGTQGVSTHLRSGGAVPELRAASMHLGERTTPRRLGRQIARAIYGGLGNPR
jgi:hypothetical protein